MRRGKRIGPFPWWFRSGSNRGIHGYEPCPLPIEVRNHVYPPPPYILHSIIPTYTVNNITLYCRYIYYTRVRAREGMLHDVTRERVSE